MMAVMMLIARNRRAMHSLTLSMRATITGWIATAVMAVAAIAMGRLERVRLVRAMVTGVKQRF